MSALRNVKVRHLFKCLQLGWARCLRGEAALAKQTQMSAWEYWMIYQPSKSPSESSIQFNKKLKPQRAINQMSFPAFLSAQSHANRFLCNEKFYDFIAINGECRSRAGRACCALIVTVCHLSISTSMVKVLVSLQPGEQWKSFVCTFAISFNWRRSFQFAARNVNEMLSGCKEWTQSHQGKNLSSPAPKNRSRNGKKGEAENPGNTCLCKQTPATRNGFFPSSIRYSVEIRGWKLNSKRLN